MVLHALLALAGLGWAGAQSGHQMWTGNSGKCWGREGGNDPGLGLIQKETGNCLGVAKLGLGHWSEAGDGLKWDWGHWSETGKADLGLGTLI